MNLYTCIWICVFHVLCILHCTPWKVQRATAKSLGKSCQSHCCCEFIYMYLNCIFHVLFVFCILHCPSCKVQLRAYVGKKPQKNLSVSLLLWIYIYVNVFLIVYLKFCCCPPGKVQQRAKSLRKSCPSHCCCESRDKHRLWGTFTCHAPTAPRRSKKETENRPVDFTKQYKMRVHATCPQCCPPYPQ